MKKPGAMVKAWAGCKPGSRSRGPAERSPNPKQSPGPVLFHGEHGGGGGGPPETTVRTMTKCGAVSIWAHLPFKARRNWCFILGIGLAQGREESAQFHISAGICWVPATWKWLRASHRFLILLVTVKHKSTAAAERKKCSHRKAYIADNFLINGQLEARCCMKEMGTNPGTKTFWRTASPEENYCHLQLRFRGASLAT